MYRQSLDGTWDLFCCAPGTLTPQECCIKAQVPGDVRLDLLRAGLIAEPLTEANVLEQNWIEEKDWWYHRTFTLPRDALRCHAELIFDGIDQTADIWCNGVSAGRANNMFREYRFDVTRLLHEGTNTLDVRLDVGLRWADDKPTAAFEKCWNNWDLRRMWMRKSQQSFYWDITPRLMTCGLWRGVRLEAYDEAAIRDVYVTSELHGADAQVTVEVETEAFADVRGQSLSAVLWDETTRETALCALDAAAAGRQKKTLRLQVPQARLWWPNGMGEPHLYELELSLLSADGRLLSQKRLRCGIRSVALEQRELNAEESTFTIKVNGERVFCKGWDWVPPDAVYARITPERERAFLQLALDCHTNMLRIWGGGIYVSDEFYDYCDEHGIMLWQDFMFACGFYPDDDPDYWKEVKNEVACVARRYRNHPSLALWCANNENQQVHESVDPDGPNIGQRLYDELMPQVLAQLDPARLYLHGSPLGGATANSNQRGDQHIWDYSMAWLTNGSRQLQIWDIAENNPKFVSEFGIVSPPNLLTARDFMGGHTPDRSSREWYHHMCYFALGFVENLLRRYYKDDPVEDPEEYTKAGQLLQAEAVSDIIETLRCRKFDCSGVLYWQFAESWGHTGYSPVDYYLRKKACYYYVRRAFAPLSAAFAECGDEVMLLNDTRADAKVEVEYGIMTFTGEVLSRALLNATAKANSAVPLGRINAAAAVNPAAAFAYVILRQGGRVLCKNRRFLAPLKTLQLPPAQLQAQIQPLAPDRWQLTLTAAAFQWDVALRQDDRFAYSDNDFDLWPGESRTITVTALQPGCACAPTITSINTYRGGNNHA